MIGLIRRLITSCRGIEREHKAFCRGKGKVKSQLLTSQTLSVRILLHLWPISPKISNWLNSRRMADISYVLNLFKLEVEGLLRISSVAMIKQTEQRSKLVKPTSNLLCRLLLRNMQVQSRRDICFPDAVKTHDYAEHLCLLKKERNPAPYDFDL
ncbi:matrix protein M [Corchorus olitorius]|uniref:Matrix protein M n=1 Tax=Corchorus olitorius TaxID=93759 RepID=A0A1R3IT21_9ROSI|nr:matrix protein M [Corchorus olitorius]